MKPSRYWLLLLFLVPIGLGLWRLRFDVEVLDLLPPEIPSVQGLKLYQQHFANARELLLTLRAPNAEQAENATRAIAGELRNRTSLVEQVTWEPPWLEHPEQSAELIAYLWLNQPPELFGQLTNRLAPDRLAATLTAAREELASSLSPGDMARLSYDPYGLTRLPESAMEAAPAFGQGLEMFGSSDGTFRLLFVQAAHDLTTYRDCARWLEAIKQAVDTALTPAERTSNGITLGYTGRPAFVAEVAGGMEHDITTSVGGTSVIIATLFWLAHRRWKPMLWLLTLLALILGATLALGGLIFGTINVVSMGFAAILLGLAVDYAVVHYQEALAHPDLSIPQIRRAIAPSIFWAAVTTITAFIVLNFGGLPGLAQLGSLVGLGVAISACVMIFAFLPPLFPGRWHPNPSPEASHSPPAGQSASDSNLQSSDPASPSPPPKEERGGERRPFSRNPINPIAAGPARRAVRLVLTAAVLLVSFGVLLRGLPPMDPTANALRPRNSPAYDALEQIKTFMNQKREPLWLLVSGPTVADVGRRLDEVQPALARAVSNNIIAGYTLPTALWPKPEFQMANRGMARALAAERQIFRQAAASNGFAESALGLTERILDTWQTAGAVSGVYWPANPMSRWIFEKFVARSPTNYFALGLLNPPTNSIPGSASRLSVLESELPQQDVRVSGWELLGSAILSSVKKNMWKLLAPMVSLVFLSLLLAFRRWQEVVLSVAVLLMSGLCLLAVMHLAGWTWNLLNLMALPLILGTGVDYSIFMQLALRRYHGDLGLAHRSVGRALLLCGATAIAGFGSLAWSSNAGMSSLGQVCAVGIAGNMLISVFLLPFWWDTLAGQAARAGGPRGNPTRPSALCPLPSAPLPAPPSTPSSLYRSELWRVGLWMVRMLPRKLCARLSCWLAGAYCHLARHRREVVIQNLLPALNNDRAAAEVKARELFHQFALKLVDLWRYEAGLPINDLFGEYSGWEHFVNAQGQKRGVLLLTPHLGNWEFGGPSLNQKGVALQVITLAEPGEQFTKLRSASRARWNIETLVIGDDPFAFVEIIRRLEAGATVALLVDRPPPRTALTVELFGRPFAASVGAAELARASGCVLLPVYLPRANNAYGAHVLPAIPYDRAALRDRQARQQLTQQIMSAFEPVIRQHLAQWYHFVPIWPET